MIPGYLNSALQEIRGFFLTIIVPALLGWIAGTCIGLGFTIMQGQGQDQLQPGEVRTSFDPTNNPPDGSMQHLVGLSKPGEIMIVLHTLNCTDCEFCKKKPRR